MVAEEGHPGALRTCRCAGGHVGPATLRVFGPAPLNLTCACPQFRGRGYYVLSCAHAWGLSRGPSRSPPFLPLISSPILSLPPAFPQDLMVGGSSLFSGGAGAGAGGGGGGGMLNLQQQQHAAGAGPPTSIFQSIQSQLPEGARLDSLIPCPGAYQGAASSMASFPCPIALAGVFGRCILLRRSRT